MNVITSHGACTRMEEENVTNNLNYVFPDIKGGRKIDCEVSLCTFFYYSGINTEAYFQSSQTSKTKHFAKLINGCQLLTASRKAPS